MFEKIKRILIQTNQVEEDCLARQLICIQLIANLYCNNNLAPAYKRAGAFYLR